MNPSRLSTPGAWAKPRVRSISPMSAVPPNSLVPMNSVTADQMNQPTKAEMRPPIIPKPPSPIEPIAVATATTPTTAAA